MDSFWMMDKYYFSKIELYDQDDIASLGIQRSLKRKKQKQVEKLEKQGILVGKNPNKLLKKIDKHGEPTTNSIASNTDDMKTQWKIALLRAQGFKVKDDRQLIKKAVARQRKLKTKQADRWRQRLGQIEKDKQNKQAKRKANLQHRRDRKLTKLLSKAKRKGRIFSAGGASNSK